MIRKVGITGQAGFIGTHLFNFLKYNRKDIELIPFRDDFFNNHEMLHSFVNKCDTIIHLAAMNRHGDPQVIYDTNVGLVQDLISVLEKNNLRPHILFSSSTQEELDNPYGRSKRTGRMIFEDWANRMNGKFTAFIIPNVFGPFGKPYYNSVISTFSYQITHNIVPKIEIDAELKLIYVNELVKIFSDAIDNNGSTIRYLKVDHTSKIRVSQILNKLNEFKNSYFNELVIPDLMNYFDVSLFNTMRSYIDKEYYPVLINQHSDERGHLFEIVKSHTGGQTFYSVTKPGMTRGNHFHTDKIERFCVVSGSAVVKLRKIGTDEIITYKVSGEQPSFIDIPVFFTHNITNIGTSDLETIFWSNEIFNPVKSDTFYEKV
jgi:UDP-2-acetamido-2,6-beta-L-arabino-hexul-4-ose reductase